MQRRSCAILVFRVDRDREREPRATDVLYVGVRIPPAIHDRPFAEGEETIVAATDEVPNPNSLDRECGIWQLEVRKR